MVSSPFHPDLSNTDPITMLRACADPVRLHLIKILDDGEEYTCSKLADLLDIPLPTMSHHLKILREAGFTFNRKEGTVRWTSLRHADLEKYFPGLIEQLVHLAKATRNPEDI